MASTIITTIFGMWYATAIAPEAAASASTATPAPPATQTQAPAKDYVFGACKRAMQRNVAANPGATKQKRRREAQERYWCDRAALWAEQEAKIEQETRSFRGLMAAARDSRCKTAICWGPSNRWGLEPLVELPVGKTFSLTPSGLGRYINNSGIGVRFNAGVRLWWRWDGVSAAVYFATPDLSNKETIVISGSDFQYPVSQIRRPVPGLAIGLLGDTVWVGFDYDQLRNGGAETTRDQRWPANEVVSHAFSVTIAVAPMAGFRNGIGTLVESNRKKEEALAQQREAEKARNEAEQARQQTEKALEAITEVVKPTTDVPAAPEPETSDATPGTTEPDGQ